MDHIQIMIIVRCACAWMVLIGSVHTAGIGKELYNISEEKCPDGYYPGEYPNQCLACSDLCHDNMEDYFVELNCQMICPEYYENLVISTASATMLPNTGAMEMPEYHYLPIIIMVVFFISACIMSIMMCCCLVAYKRIRNKNTASRDGPSSNHSVPDESIPIPVENGDTSSELPWAVHTSAIVPSGTRYTENTEARSLLGTDMRQTVV